MAHPDWFPLRLLRLLVLGACLLFISGSSAADMPALSVPAATATWGLLMNPGFTAAPLKGVYFFAGSARDARFRHPSEVQTSPNTALYTLTPRDDRHLRWGQSLANRQLALEQIAASGANTVVLSVWGEPQADRWRYWAPMQSSPQAHDQVFSLAARHNLLIIPAIESSDGTLGCGGNTAAYHFAADFPGSAAAPAPQLVAQVSALVERYLILPANPTWPQRWAQIANHAGEPRYAIHLLHVASRQLAPHEHQRFAAGFDAVAEAVFQRTGVRVGFLLDSVPRPRAGFGELCANEPGLPFIDTYILNPRESGPYLRQADSLLAIQGFIPEIYRNSSDESLLIGEKQGYLQRWINTGIPVILDASPGYDARRVFARSPRYGHSESWYAAVGALYDLGCRGVVFNTWNGYTEGYAAVPTHEHGDRPYQWLRSLFQRVDRDAPTSAGASRTFTLWGGKPGSLSAGRDASD